MNITATNTYEGNKIKAVILISGRGSNMEALIRAASQPDFPVIICGVISDNPSAKGLAIAADMGVKTHVVSPKEFSTKAECDAKLTEAIKDLGGVIILCAGYMRILSASFLNIWQNSVLNIHPSLLPEYKGLNTHKRVINDKRSETGCTVHIVTPQLDDGPILAQQKVFVHQNDTPDSLAEKVLLQEHLLYPRAVAEYAKKLLKQ